MPVGIQIQIDRTVSITAISHHRTNGRRLDRVGRHLDQFGISINKALTSRALES